jgi:flagellar protein FlaJ
MAERITIPFSPLPMPVMKNISENFRGVGEKIANAFPYLGIELRQAEIPLAAKEYGSIMFTMSVFYFIVGSLLVYVFALRFAPDKAIPAALTIGGIFALLIFVQLSVFPKIRIMRKVRDLESNLIFALRTILIEIKSGVSLFDSIRLVANGNFGNVSREFKRAVGEIETGRFQEDVFEDLATNNPSLFFRRALWQLVNGLKAGADVSEVLNSLVDTLSKEQSNQVRMYGSSLRLLSLMYMMLGVIVPALGLTFLVVLSSFPQIKIAEWMFWAMLITLAIGQFMFLGMLKSNRPSLLGW